jgi:uncharacterized protein YbcV (DUF1398 family)
MNEQTEMALREVSRGADENRLSFPEGLAKLASVGAEGYLVDFRAQQKTFYLSDGEALSVASKHTPYNVAASFDTVALQEALREAQSAPPDYTYQRFCERATAAGCAGYIVSLLGRRVTYFGRTGETHVELFPS